MAKWFLALYHAQTLTCPWENLRAPRILRKKTPGPSAAGVVPPSLRQNREAQGEGSRAKIPRRAGKWTNKLLPLGEEICYSTHLNR
jgi:hypothetical protein